MHNNNYLKETHFYSTLIKDFRINETNICEPAHDVKFVSIGISLFNMPISLSYIKQSKIHVKEVRHIELSKAAPKRSICHFQKLEMILQ